MGCHKDVSPTPYLHCVVLSVVGPASGFPSLGVGVVATLGIMYYDSDPPLTSYS